MKIYVQSPGAASQHRVDVTSADLSEIFDVDQPDSLNFRSSATHVRQNSLVLAYSDEDRLQFVGHINSITYEDEHHRTYSCDSAEHHLMNRVSPRVAYPGGVGLHLSDVLASDPPSQSPGAAQYVQGLLWLAKSAVTAGLVVWNVDGVGRLTGWGPTASTRDIYLDGRILEPVTYANLTSGAYRCAIDGVDLCVRGLGPGDVYGVVAIDHFSENAVELGKLDTDPEIDSVYALETACIWDHIRDLVEEMGLYIHLRRSDGSLYIDLVDCPYQRSSEDAPLSCGKYSILEMQPALYPPHSAIVGVGENGDSIVGQNYIAGLASTIGKAWTEAKESIEGAWKSPAGVLEQIVDYAFSRVQMLPPITASITGEEHVQPGEWYMIAGESRLCQSVSIAFPGETRAVFGAPALSLQESMAEKAATKAIGTFRKKFEPLDGNATESGSIWITDGRVNVSGSRTYVNDGILYIINCDTMYLESYNLDPFYHIANSRLEIVVSLDGQYYNTVVIDGEYIFIHGSSTILKYDMNGKLKTFKLLSGNVSFCEYQDDYLAVVTSNSSWLYIYDKDFNLITSYNFGNFGLEDMCPSTTTRTHGIFGICYDGEDLYFSARHRHKNSSGCEQYKAILWKFDVSESELKGVEQPTTLPGATWYAGGCVFVLRRVNDYWEKYDVTDDYPEYISSTALGVNGGSSDGEHLYRLPEENQVLVMDTDLEQIDDLDLRYTGFQGATPLEVTFDVGDLGGVADLVTLSVTGSGEMDSPDAMAEVHVVKKVQTSEVPELYRYDPVAVVRWTGLLGGIVTDLDITEFCDQEEFAALSTSMAGENNDLTLTSKLSGAPGELITLTLLNPGGTGNLSISVTDYDIVVTLKRSGGTITSTAQQVIDALTADEDASALVFAAKKGDQTGEGVVTALEKSALKLIDTVFQVYIIWPYDLAVEESFSVSIQGYVRK